MSALLALALGVAAGLAQVEAAPTLFAEPRAAPLLPLAVVAGWSAARGLGEAAPALLGAAVVLGAASEERAGWFLLAMLPAAALIAGASAGSPASSGASSGPPATWLRGLLLAPAVAGLGAALYQGLLHLVAGELGVLGDDRAAVLAAAAWTAALAGVLALLAWPLRPRPAGGLFR